MLAFCPPTLSSIFVDGRGHCPLPRIVPRLHPLQCDCWCWEHHPVSCHRCIPSQQPWCRCCGPIPACKAMRRTITKARMNRQYIVLDSIIHQLPEGSSTHRTRFPFLTSVKMSVKNVAVIAVSNELTSKILGREVGYIIRPLLDSVVKTAAVGSCGLSIFLPISRVTRVDYLVQI